MSVLAVAGVLGVTAVAAYGIPAVVLRLIWPVIDSGRLSVVNYRGARVAPALWIAFVAWALALATLRLALSFYPAPHGYVLVHTGSLERSAGLLLTLRTVSPLFSMAIAVAAGALVFGVIDDIWGGHDAKGFRGHVASLRARKLTTGGLKLLGIGGVAFVAAGYTSLSARLATAEQQAYAETLNPVPSTLLTVLVGTLVIALSANAVNLADLRPGRALKVGFVLLPFALLSVLALFAGEGAPAPERALGAAIVAVALLGPMLAMWPYDVHERGMLGDAGANALGALLGFVIFTGIAPAATAGSGLALAVLSVIAGLLLVVNVVSERVSYSEVIERTSVLRWLDQLGRPRFDEVADSRPQERSDRDGD